MVGLIQPAPPLEHSRVVQRQQLKRLEKRTHRGDSSLAMKSQLIAIVAAMLLVGCGKSQDTDLNGKWLGKGYTCFESLDADGNPVGDVKSDQEISISQDGDKVVATKITGDECVKAGEKTWEGKISGDWIEGVIYGWAANSPKPIPHKARIEIKSSNLLYLAPNGLEFVRILDAQ